MPPEISDLVLPGSLVGIREIRRCIRNLEIIEDQLVTEVVKVRSGAVPAAHAVPVPRLIEELVTINQRPLKTKADVESLKSRLEKFASAAPRFRLTFPSEPDDALLSRIVDWLRANISANILVDIGISPYLAGGFVIQTPTRRYDLSWRRRFEDRGTHFADLVRSDSEA